MQHLLVLVAMLACCRGASVRHNKLPDLDNSIQPNGVLPTKHTGRKFVTITRRPLERNPHQPGTTVELTCDAVGSPAPTVRWFKNDAPVYEHDLESNEVLDAGPSSFARISSTLLIPWTSGQDHYSCLATAGAKTVKASAIVYTTGGSTDLTERTKLVPLSPRILVSYKVFIGTIGTNVVLPCRAKGHPRPRVVWTDNRGAVIKKSPRMKVRRSGELVIANVRWGDMGEFSCDASNLFGSQNATTFVYPARAG